MSPESAATDYLHKDLTRSIIGGFYDVFNQLGPGFLESVYEKALYISLSEAGLSVVRQRPVRVYFRGRTVGRFRADLMVNDSVVVELKATEHLISRHRAQLINLLRASTVEVGLLMNFGPNPVAQRVVYSNARKHLPAHLLA